MTAVIILKDRAKIKLFSFANQTENGKNEARRGLGVGASDVTLS